MATKSIFTEQTSIADFGSSGPQRLTIQGYQNNDKLFIMNMNGAITPNYQLMYSIGPDAFINAFSQRMTFWNLRGLHVYKDCHGNDIADVGNTVPEFETFYNENNIVVAKKPLVLAFIGTVLEGFLVNLQFDDFKKASNANELEAIIFTLVFLGRAKNVLDKQSLISAVKTAPTSGGTVPVRSATPSAPSNMSSGLNATETSNYVSTGMNMVRVTDMPNNYLTRVR